MDRSVFVLLLLSGLFWSSSALSRQYHYINVRMSWPEAQSYCREKYTDLATVDTMDDVNRLVNIVDAGYSGSVWIGLKRGTQTRWAWSNGENKSSLYSNWASGEPNQNEDCVSILYGSWFDMGCSYRRYFVCYKENNGYTMVKTAKTWSDAQSYCRQYHTDLATIHNSEENQQITQILFSGYYIWIGLFQDSWEWSDKWSRFFRNWAAGQPSQTSGSGDCVGMSTTNSGKWAQENCDLQQPFICYGWRKYQYQFINESKTWQDAQSYCRARFTDLATADNMSDVSLLVNSVDAGYRGSVWIGLHNGAEYRWVWSMGSLSRYSNWYPGEPNGDGECVISFNGRWYDESCSAVLPFVCFNDSTGFIITETALTWRDAQSYCRKQHTDLASISSAKQQNLIGNAGSLWIGLFKDSWEWSDRWNLSFRNWAAGQPSQSSGSGDCVGISTTDTGKWARYSCDLQQPFICYGDDTLIKKQIIRLKLSCNGECTLNDPSRQTAILNEISEKLKIMGLEGDSKINWRKGEGENVFHQEITRTASSSNKCNKK
ncbi:macrophage mannose receptor 1-like isoform X1 [Pimephales promelas]|uniref:macrophage mannose receptor 1-like isoform X1 n=1 Tax=Pimephales promelas TaxID=90988 RepID=UPI001955DFDF|nr:macrophage mannose receptor 1-like isoform X1 [Pimephales promelas]